MASVLLRKGHTHKGIFLYDVRDGDWSVAAIQETTRIGGKPWMPGRGKEGFSSVVFRESVALLIRNTRLLASRTKREYITVVLSHPLCATWIQQTWELIYHPSNKSHHSPRFCTDDKLPTLRYRNRSSSLLIVHMQFPSTYKFLRKVPTT